MRSHVLSAAILALGILPPVGARADFQWLDSWQVTEGGDYPSDYSFSPAEPNGGSISASSHARFEQLSNGFIVAMTSQEAVFSRAFELRGSPDGWAVVLSGSMNGSVTQIDAYATATTYAFTTGIGWSMQSPDSESGGFSISQTGSATLSDGNYELMVSNFTTSGLNPTVFRGGYGDITDSFSVTMTATPLSSPPSVPEPGSLLLLSIGSAALLGVAVGKVRRKGNRF